MDLPHQDREAAARLQLPTLSPCIALSATSLLRPAQGAMMNPITGHRDSTMGSKRFLFTLTGALALAQGGLAEHHSEAADPPEVVTASVQGTITFLYYQDLQAAAEFYRHIIGLNTTMDEDWVKIFEITPGSSVGLVKQGHGLHEPAADKPVMLSLVTDEVDGWYARMQDAGVKILKPLPPADGKIKPGAAPVRGFIAQDPEGYTIEFFSWQAKPPQ